MSAGGGAGRVFGAVAGTAVAERDAESPEAAAAGVCASGGTLAPATSPAPGFSCRTVVVGGGVASPVVGVACLDLPELEAPR